jgi:hypothetical protein
MHFCLPSDYFLVMTQVILHSLVSLQISDQIACSRDGSAGENHQVSVLRGLIGRMDNNVIEVLTSFEIPRTPLDKQFISDRTQMYRGISLISLRISSLLAVFGDVRLVGIFIVGADDTPDEILLSSLGIGEMFVIIRSDCADILSASAYSYCKSLKLPLPITWEVSESENYCMHAMDRAPFGTRGPSLNECGKRVQLSHQRMISGIKNLVRLLDSANDSKRSYELLRKVHFLVQCLRNLKVDDPSHDKGLSPITETAALAHACRVANDIACFLERKVTSAK